MQPLNVRTVAVRVAALALLLLLVLVATLSVRTLNRVPNTLLYFVRSDSRSFTLQSAPRRLPQLERRRRRESEAEASLTRALQTLVDGPSPEEAAQGLTTSLPAATRVLSLQIKGREVWVDLSSAFAAGGGSAEMLGRLFQVFYTLTQPSYVDSVRLFVDGEPVSVFGGEGIMVDNPWRRAERETLPVW